jgi:hypothetical protein
VELPGEESALLTPSTRRAGIAILVAFFASQALAVLPDPQQGTTAFAGGRLFQLRGGQITAIDHRGPQAMSGFGSDNKQIVAGDGMLYILKRQQGVLRYDARSDRFDTIDNGAATKQIAADGRNVYVLKDNGNIFRYQGQGMNWTMVDDGTRTAGIVATGDVLWILKDVGTVFRWDRRTNRFAKLGSNRFTVAMHRDSSGGTSAVVVENGRIFRVEEGGRHPRFVVDGNAVVVLDRQGRTVRRFQPDTGHWEQIDAGANTMMISGAGGNVFVTKDTGQSYRWTRQGMNWDVIDDGGDTRRVSAVGDSLWVLKNSGQLWRIGVRGRDYQKQTERGFFQTTDSGLGGSRFTVVSTATDLFTFRDGSGGSPWAAKRADIFEQLHTAE